MSGAWILEVLREPATRDCIALSGKVALVAMPLLAVGGVGLGYVLGTGKGRWLPLLDFLVTLPLVFPPIATGFLLLLALGRRSVVGLWPQRISRPGNNFQFLGRGSGQPVLLDCPLS